MPQLFIRGTLRYGLPLACYSCFIFILSSQPAAKLPSIQIWDKLVHSIEYALLGFLLYRCFHFATKSWRGPFVSTAAFLAVFACCDELWQSTIPGRHADPYDWVADIIGGVLGAIAYRLIYLGWNTLRAQ